MPEPEFGQTMKSFFTINDSEVAPSCPACGVQINHLSGTLPLALCAKDLSECPYPKKAVHFKAAGRCGCPKTHTFQVTLTVEGPVIYPAENNEEDGKGFNPFLKGF